MKQQSIAAKLIALHKACKAKGILEANILVLLHLQDKGPSIVGSVSRSTGILPTQMSRCTRKLEEMDLIERSFPKEDHRQVLLTITAKGEAFMKEILG